MPTLPPNRSYTLIVFLSAACVVVGSIRWTVSRTIRQDNLNEQCYAALRSNGTSELTDMLEHGADPNYVPSPQGTFPSNIFHKTGMPLLGYAMNGFSNPSTKQYLKQNAKWFKAMHVVPPTLACTDPLAKMRVLLEHHADPNLCYYKANPLVHAVGVNSAEAVQLLLKYGADPDAPSANGDTARSVATRNKNAAMLALMTVKQ